MFNADFYPTPEAVLHDMLNGFSFENKTILEPSAGKGNIVDHLLNYGAKEVLACELNDDLRSILHQKCKVIGSDFLTITSEQVSHIDAVVMNPPFSADEQHILHAFEIAPAGCMIIALCNYSTIKNTYTRSRQRLSNIIDQYGSVINLGDCFSDAERTTNVQIGLVRLQKPGANYSTEFEGFFLEEDPEEEQGNGIMSYNFIRDLVNRYVAAIKIYDDQLEAAVKMNNLTSGFYSSSLAFTCTEDNKPKSRNDFKKDLQKSGWKFIFNKMNMQKYATRGLREDINKFVEQQTQVPFTMRNIYQMLNVIIGTQGQRMDKALLEVFDKLTMHYHDNRYNVEGWKTNSHYLVNEKFIIDGICWQDQRWYKGESKIQIGYHLEILEDLMKALCYLTGDNYDEKITLNQAIKYNYKVLVDGEARYAYLSQREADNMLKHLESKGIDAYFKYDVDQVYGEWFDWTYFECRAFKKGTMHFKFKDKNVWGLFNQRVAKIKGYPLFEGGVKKPKQEHKKSKPEPQPMAEAGSLMLIF